jgi:hypothetical protein
VRKRNKPKSGDYCCCCGETLKLDWHHRWPTTQGGPDIDENKERACRAHHDIYTQICGCDLKRTPEYRVKNLLRWLAEFPGVDLFGAGIPGDPQRMAPECVLLERDHWVWHKEYKDFSEGRFSKHEPVKGMYPERESTKQMRRRPL